MTFITVHGEVSCLLRFPPGVNSGACTSQFVSGKVLCLLIFTPTANSVAHTLQFGDSGLILYWSRIRKFVTHREHTYGEQTENREFNYRGHSNP